MEGLVCHIQDLGICPVGYGKQEVSWLVCASNWSVSRYCTESSIL